MEAHEILLAYIHTNADLFAKFDKSKILSYAVDKKLMRKENSKKKEGRSTVIN